MSSRLLLVCAECGFGAPFLAIALILVHYHLRRAAWSHHRRHDKSPGFCPSSAALGVIFLLTQTFYRPSVSHEIEARLVEPVEDDDDGEPESSARQLSRQLSRIARGASLRF